MANFRYFNDSFHCFICLLRSNVINKYGEINLMIQIKPLREQDRLAECHLERLESLSGIAFSKDELA